MAQYRVIVNTVTKEIEDIIKVENERSITYLPINAKGEDLEWYVIPEARIDEIERKLKTEVGMKTDKIKEEKEKEKDPKIKEK